MLMVEVGFIEPNDPRMISTMEQIENVLRAAPISCAIEAPDEFRDAKDRVFNTCSFWRIGRLARMGRTEEAREYFRTIARDVETD